MKAIELRTSFEEWTKAESFVKAHQAEDTFIYQLDNVTMIIVTDGEYSMDYIKSAILFTFEEYYIKELK